MWKLFDLNLSPRRVVKKNKIFCLNDCKKLLRIAAVFGIDCFISMLAKIEQGNR